MNKIQKENSKTKNERKEVRRRKDRQKEEL